ncbi:hypothetical protein [Priestia koreensis]|uniref:hypothetical protein n=1 Tax=Priestia koreensis TaxID=284581 RepID=UPI003015D7E2
MKKMMIMIALASLLGCSNKEEKDVHPPAMFIQQGDQQHKTYLGSYCWSGVGQAVCVDKAAPEKIVKGKKAIEVKPGETLSFVINAKRTPTSATLSQRVDGTEKKVRTNHDQFKVPTERGTYGYVYEAKWSEQKAKDVPANIAPYVFLIQVKE